MPKKATRVHEPIVYYPQHARMKGYRAEMSVLALLGIAFCVCFPIGAFAESHPKKASKQPHISAPIQLPKAVEHETQSEHEARLKGRRYATGQFDTSVMGLPQHYRGNSFMTLYRAAVVVAPKGEFETTAEYDARLAKHVEGVEGTYAIVLNRTDGPNYDADKETFSISVPIGAAFVGVSGEADFRDYRECFPVDFVFVGESQHPAGNAFGASRIVKSTRSDTRAVLPVGLSDGATFEFKIPRAEAQRIKPQLKLKVLVIGSISPRQEPVIHAASERNGASYKDATFDDASESHTDYYLLRMHIEDLWLFDFETGVIFAKHSDPDVARSIALKIPQLVGGLSKPSGNTADDLARRASDELADIQERKLSIQNQLIRNGAQLSGH
jgi:hypothetical protein